MRNQSASLFRQNVLSSTGKAAHVRLYLETIKKRFLWEHISLKLIKFVAFFFKTLPRF